MPFTRRQIVLGLLATGATAHAQQLAHAGWRGNSIVPEAWWKHATFVRCAAPTYTFAQITQALDSFLEVGADSIILPDLLNKTGNADGSFHDDPPHPLAGLFLAEFGTEDELDTLLRETSARRMHVLLTMPLNRVVADPGAVRFWMTRGISGIDLGILTDSDRSALRSLRDTLDHYPGQRILIASTTVAFDARKHDLVTLHIVGEGGTGAPNQLVQINELQRPAVAADAPASTLPGSVSSLGSLVPLLLNGGAPILDSRLLETEQDRGAVQQVLQLRNTHATFRNGTASVLATGQPDLHAWLVRSRNGRENLLLVVNQAKSDATLKLTGAFAAQHVRAGYLRALLRSDGAMGSLNLETGVLPPGAAIVGELHADYYATPSTTLDPDAPPPGAATHRRRKHRRK